jgi:hypothetical protein
MSTRPKTTSALRRGIRWLATEVVLAIIGDTVLAGRGQLKPRLKSLQPPSPPARTAQTQTLPGARPGRGRVSATRDGGFRGGAQRGRSGAV